MKILYVGPHVEKIHTGGDSVNKRNLDLLVDIFNEDLSIYSIASPLNTIFQKLKGYLGGITPRIIADILGLIDENKIDCVFLSQSFYGKLSHAIRRKFPNIRIITFYHNIEKHYAKEFVRVSGFVHYPFYFLASYNEALTIRNSNFNFVLNERDSILMNDIYSVSSDLQLPVSYEDIFSKDKIEDKFNNPLKIIFVGTAFFGNIPGIKFFVKEVMPHVSAELIIVGKGMEAYKNQLEIAENIKVYGFVDDLSSLYYTASVVVAPIFSGGGMKTKIAEALMYGKTIVGTSEAFEGYKQAEGVTYVCNSANEFITCIKNMEIANSRPKPFNIKARALFENNYDNKVLKNGLKNFFLTNYS